MDTVPQTEESIFIRALEIDSPDERDAYLATVCGGDMQLKSRVDALLERHQQTDGMLDAPPPGITATPGAADTQVNIGALIDRYKIVRLIGEGGFGDVYLAEQQEPVRRQVALKVIKLGMDTRLVIARFEAERQALALMDHPNIAKVHDAGATAAGRPYFVMELAQGLPITQYCDANHVTTQERLRLFIDVCHAVQHAHQKGIIHRDLKPTNILVTQQDGKPVPKIIDFGVAKATQQRLTEETVLTQHSQLVGTPEYMSPEQATFGESDVDTRSDIYSLGVLLYELIVGVRPFDSERLRSRGYDEICRVIRESEPPAPSRQLSTLGEAIIDVCQHRQTQPAVLRRTVLGDLDWIVMKCLDKDRTQRYETVEGLSRDIERHLNHEPVEARAPSRVYRMQKYVRKHRGPVAAAASFLAAICLCLVVATVGFLAAVKQRDRANEQRELANVHKDRAEKLALQSLRKLYASEVNLAYQALDQGNLHQVKALLTRQEADRAAEEDLRGFEWYYLSSRYKSLLRTPTLTHGSRVTAVAYSPDGSMVASGDLDGTVKIWDAQSRELIHNLQGHTSFVSFVVFAPDGKTLVSSSRDNTVRLWNVHTGGRIKIFDTARMAVSPIFSRDGNTLTVVTGGGRILQWDMATFEEVDSTPSLNPLVAVREASFSPHRKTLVSGNNNVGLRIWDLSTGTVLAPLPGPTFSLHSIAHSPNGEMLAVGGLDDVVSIWNVTNPSRPERRMSPTGTSNLVRHLAYSPDGKILAGAGWDKTIKLWDAQTGALLTSLRGHSHFANCLAFSSDGRELVSGGNDHTVRFWELDEIVERLMPAQPIGIEASLAFSSDRKTVALAGGDDHSRHEASGQVTLWNTVTGEMRCVLMELPAPATAVKFSPDDRLLAVGVDAWNSAEKKWSREIRCVDLSSGRVAFTLTGHTGRVTSLDFSPVDETLLASASRDGTVRIWSTTERRQLSLLPSSRDHALSVAYSPDGKMLASGYRDPAFTYGYVKFWDVASGSEIKKISDYTTPVNSVSFSPDGSLLAAGGGDSTVRLIDTRTYDQVVLRGHRFMVHGVAFSPDGKTLASCGRVGAVKLWHVGTGQELATLKTRPWMTAIEFSPDGKALAAAGQDKTITLWHSEPNKVQGTLLGSVLLRAPAPSGGSDL